MDSFKQSRFTQQASGSAAMAPARAPVRLLPPLALSLVLAACGGGSSGDGFTPPAPPPVVCTATDGGGVGFSLGVCIDASGETRTVLQPAEAAVVMVDDDPSGQAYTLSLSAPATFPAVSITQANRPPVGTRDIIGRLRGEAYEVDSDADGLTLTPPYAALIDFRAARDYTAAQGAAPLAPLALAGFGIWERFGTASFGDGYFGGWYAPRAAATALDARPTSVREYAGVAVGVLSPKGGSGSRTGSQGFSAKVRLVAGATGITLGVITEVDVSRGSEPDLVVQRLGLKDLEFTGLDNNAGQPVNGSLVTSPGAGADATGRVEARFLGLTDGGPGDPGREIVGRFVFETSDGMVGTGAFGAAASQP